MNNNNPKFLTFILTLSLLFTLTSCSNVRWKHPTPSDDIILTMARQIQGAENIDGKPFPLEYTVEVLKHKAVDANTQGFKIVALAPDNELIIAGYDTSLALIGLRSEPDFNHYAIPNPDNIQGFFYTYHGTLKSIRYAVPHMIKDSDTKSDLVLYSQPLTDFNVTLIYKDGSQYPFKLHSSPVSRGIIGRYKNYSNSFDGVFSVIYNYRAEKFSLYGPRNN